MTPAGTSNELDVQNEWEENTHIRIKPLHDIIAMYVQGHQTEENKRTKEGGVGVEILYDNRAYRQTIRQ